MAFPPGATSGSLAKQDDAEITEADLTKLNEAKLQFGGADCVFTRMSGTSAIRRVRQAVESARPRSLLSCRPIVPV